MQISMINAEWFKAEFHEALAGYEVQHRFFPDGDFGDLDQVEFNSLKKGGGIDFWSSGMLFVHLVDYVTDEELINVMLDPDQKSEKAAVLAKLRSML